MKELSNGDLLVYDSLFFYYYYFSSLSFLCKNNIKEKPTKKKMMDIGSCRYIQMEQTKNHQQVWFHLFLFLIL